MTENMDITWNFGRGFIWSSIEPSLGIISACLPTLRPLVRYIFPSGLGRSQKTSDFYRLKERGAYPSGSGGHAPGNSKIRRGSLDSAAHLEPQNDPNSFIMVRRDISWSSKQDGD